MPATIVCTYGAGWERRELGEGAGGQSDNDSNGLHDCGVCCKERMYVCCVGNHDADGRDILCLSQFNDSRKWVADEDTGRGCKKEEVGKA